MVLAYNNIILLVATNKIPFYSEVIDKGSFSHFHYNPVFISDNYLNEYIKLFGLPDLETNYILKSFTQQEVRSYEQAYSTFASPRHYNNQPIGISHTRWQPGYVTNTTGREVSWITESGDSFTVPSLTQASEYLEVSKQTLRKYANCLADIFVNSPTYGDVKVTIKDLPFVDLPSDREVGLKNIPLDVSGMKPNKLYLYDMSLKQLPHGPYNSVYDANKALDLPLNKRYYTFVNKYRSVFVPLLGTSVYYVCNRVSYHKEALVHNLTDDVIKHFASMSSAVKFVSPSISVPSFISQFVLRRRQYEQGGKEYLVEFANPSDHDATLSRVLQEYKKYNKALWAKKVGANNIYYYKSPVII